MYGFFHAIDIFALNPNGDVARTTRHLSGGMRPRTDARARVWGTGLKILIAILLAFGAAGAGVGWVVGSRSLYQREYDPLDPPMLGRRQIMAVIKRRKT